MLPTRDIICPPDTQIKYDTNNSKVKIEKNIQSKQ